MERFINAIQLIQFILRALIILLCVNLLYFVLNDNITGHLSWLPITSLLCTLCIYCKSLWGHLLFLLLHTVINNLKKVVSYLCLYMSCGQKPPQCGSTETNDTTWRVFKMLACSCVNSLRVQGSSYSGVWHTWLKDMWSQNDQTLVFSLLEFES